MDQLELQRQAFKQAIGQDIAVPGADRALELRAKLVGVSDAPSVTVDVLWINGDKRVYSFGEIQLLPASS